MQKKGNILSYIFWNLCCLWSVFIGNITTLNAQDIAFDQYHQTPFVSNIAWIGLDTTMRATLHYRQQPLPTGESFTTPMFSFTYPLLQKKANSSHTKAAIGLNVINDNITDFFQTSGACIGLSYNLPLSATMQASFGMQAGFFQQSLNLKNITTDNQFLTGIYNPNASLNENFSNSNTNTTYLLMSAGLLLHWQNKSSIIPNRFIGISYHNFNEPSRTFLEGVVDKVPSNIAFMAGFGFQQNYRLSWTPNLRLISRLGKTYGMVGTWFHYNLSYFAEDGQLSLGMWYNTNQALSVCLEVSQKKFLASFNYNLPLSSQATAWQGSGSLELTLGIRIGRKRKEVEPPKEDSIPKDTLLVVEKVIPTDTLILAKEDSIFYVRVQTFEAYNGTDSLVLDTLERKKSVEELVKTPETQEVIDTFYVEAEIEYEQQYAFFEKGTAIYKQETQEVLFEVLAILLNDPFISIELRGYTDNQEAVGTSFTLSQKRAEAIMAFFLKQGIREDRILLNPQGESPPIFLEQPIKEDEQKRRVAIIFFYPSADNK